MKNFSLRASLALLLAFFLSSPFAAPSCEPKQIAGTGTKAAMYAAADGIGAYYWCPGKYAPELVWVGATDPSMLTKLNQEALGYDNTTLAFRGLWAKYFAAPPTTPEFNALRNHIIEAAGATQPANPPWVVATNGTATSRPTYWLKNGVKGVKAIQNIPIKTADGKPRSCFCGSAAGRFISGSSTSCTFDGAKSGADGIEVTVCSAAK